MDITTLGLAVDSSQVTEAVAELDKLAASGVAAEQSMGKLASAEGTGKVVPIFQATRHELDALSVSGGKAEAALGRLAETSSQPVTSGYRESRSELQKLVDSTKRAREATEKLAATDGAPKASIAGYKATADALDHMAASGGKAGAALAAVGASGDSTRLAAGAKATAAELERLAEAGVKVGSSAGRAAQAEQTWAQRQSAILATMRSRRTAVVELNADQEKFISALQRQIETTGLSRAKLLELKAAELGVGDQAKKMIAQLEAAEAAHKKHTVGAHAGTAALNGFSLSSARARRELAEVARGLARNDFTQVTSSFSTFAATSGLLQKALSPVGLIVTGVAVAVGTLIAALHSADERQAAFHKALILTGNYAGITAAQLDEMAKAIGRASGRDGADALTALAASGRFAAASMSLVGEAVTQMNRVLGVEIKDAVAQFVSLSEEPGKASAKLNESLHYLTLETYRRIRALEEQGQKEEAAALAEASYAQAAIDRARRVEAEMGLLGRTMLGTKDIALGMWHAIANGVAGIGAAQSAAQKMIDLRRQLTYLEQFGGSKERKQELRDEMAGLSRQTLRDMENATAEGVRSRDQKEKIAAQQEWDDRKKALRTNYEKYQEERAKILKQGKLLAIPEGEIDAQLEAAKERYKDKKGAKASDTTRQDNRALLAAELEIIKRAEQEKLNVYTNSDKVLEAQRSAGLVNEADYYAKKREFIQQTEAVQVKALEKEIELRKAETFTGKTATADRINNQREIDKLEGEITKKRQDATTALEVLGIRQKAAVNAVKQAFEDAREAAEQYLESLKRGQERELAGFGAGQAERDRQAGRAQIEDKYDHQRRELEKFKRDALLNDKFGPDSDARKYYDNQLAIIREFQAKSLESFDQYWTKRKDQEGSFYLGAQEALRNYADDANNVYRQTEHAVSNALQGMEDALVKFVTTGKLDFKSLADSIVADITRIIIKQQISNALGVGGGAGGSGGGDMLTSIIGMAAGAFGGFSNSMATTMANNSGTGLDGLIRATNGWGTMGRALGGPVEAGKLYEVNERQPELLNVAGRQFLMMGDERGSVTSKAPPVESAAPTYLTVHVAAPANTSRESALQWGASAGRQIQHAMRRNGR